jgi:hypothetical protein
VVYDHLFYTTASGNTPLTATGYLYNGVDLLQFSSLAVDKFDLMVKDGLMTAKTSLKGYFPTSGSVSITTVSGTLLSFGSYKMQIGNTVTAASTATAQPVTDFTLSINNNAEAIFESGQAATSRVFWKQNTITGTFTHYFENVVERNNYLNVNKQSMIVTASGINIYGSYYEGLTIRLAKMLYTDATIDTGLDNFYAVKTTFEAEVDPSQGLQYDITLRNYRSSLYA